MSELAVGSLKGLAANGFVIDVAAGSTLVQPGQILQVVSAQMSAVQVTSVAPGVFTDLDDLSITLTPSSNTSKFWILTTFYGNGGDTGATNMFLGVRVMRDATQVALSRTSIQGTGFATNFVSATAYVLDEPNTTSSITYKSQAAHFGTGARALKVNRNQSDTALIANSFLTVMEVAG